MEASERVIKLRQRMGLSRDAMAARLGVTPQSIYRWEHGIKKPSNMALKLLEEFEKGE